MQDQLRTSGVVWDSTLAKTPVLSSVEGEYCSLTMVAKTIKRLRLLLQEVGYKFEGPTQVYCDNQA
eukprot:Pgem_evm1s247